MKNTIKNSLTIFIVILLFNLACKTADAEDMLTNHEQSFLSSARVMSLVAIKMLIQNTENNSTMLNTEINNRLDQIFDDVNDNIIDVIRIIIIDDSVGSGDNGNNNSIVNWANISYNNGKKNNNFKLKGVNFSYGIETLLDGHDTNNKIALGLVTSFRGNNVIINNDDISSKINISYISGTLYSRYNLTDMLFINGILSYYYGKYNESNGDNTNNINNYNSHQLSTNILAGANTKYIVAKIGLNHRILMVDPHKDIYKNDISKNTYNFLNATLGITLKNFIDINNLFNTKSIKFKPQLFIEIGMDIIEPKNRDINNLIHVTNNNNVILANPVDIIDSNGDNSNIFMQCGFNLNINIKNTFNVAVGYNHINRKGYVGNSVGVNVAYEF
jgi:hypothetical protein